MGRDEETATFTLLGTEKCWGPGMTIAWWDHHLLRLLRLLRGYKTSKRYCNVTKSNARVYPPSWRDAGISMAREDHVAEAEDLLAEGK